MKLGMAILNVVILVQFSASAAPLAKITCEGAQLDGNSDPVLTFQVTLHPNANPELAPSLQSAVFQFCGSSTSSVPLALTAPEIAAVANNPDTHEVTIWKEVNCRFVTDGVYAVTLRIGTNRTTATSITLDRQRLKETRLESGGRLISGKQ